MKKILLLFVFFSAGINVLSAQENLPSSRRDFEGELHYRSLENCDKVRAWMSSGISYNGARNLVFIIKGDKVLMKDESMRFNVLLDPAKDIVLYYSSDINKGVEIEYHKYAEKQALYSEKGYYNEGIGGYIKPDVYHFEPKEGEYLFEGKPMQLSQGRIEYSLGEMVGSIVTIFELAEDTSYRMPKVLNVIFCYGLETDNLLTRYMYDLIIDITLTGRAKGYACADLKKKIERAVEDAEFEIPEGLKIEKETGPAYFTLMKFWKEQTKYLKKQHIHPTQVTKEIVYDINEEWDF